MQDDLATKLQALEARVAALESQGGGSEHVQRESLLQKLLDLGQRVEQLEKAFGGNQQAPNQPPSSALQTPGAVATEDRLSQELLSHGMNEFVFKRMPGDYYERDLEYRRECLGAASIQHLCKSIIMENTNAPADFQDCGTHAASRFYCVIVQYAARLNADKLKRFLHKLNGKLGGKHFNMRLAHPHDSDRLTSFTHNAVSPVGMSTKLPIILSHHINTLQPNFFYLGGGEVDLKLGLNVAAFQAAYRPLVVECTHSNSEATSDNATCLSY